MLHGRRIGVILTGVLVGLAGGCTKPNVGQRMSLTEGENAYAARDYRRAIEETSKLTRELAGGPEVARARYVRGLAYAMVGDRAKAIDDLRYAREHGDGQLRWQPSAALGVMYFEDEHFDWAAPLLAHAVEHGDSAIRDALLYRLGMAYERCGRWSDARTTFAKVVRQYSSTQYGRLAQRRLDLNADHFAIQCGVFTSSANAQQLANSLRGKGITANVRTELRSGTQSFVVLAGKYLTYAQATAGLARVRGYVADAALWPG